MVLVWIIFLGLTIFNARALRKFMQFSAYNDLISAVNNHSDYFIESDAGLANQKITSAIEDLEKYKKHFPQKDGDLLLLVFHVKQYLATQKAGDTAKAQILFDELLYKVGKEKEEDLNKFVNLIKTLDDSMIKNQQTDGS